jgi:hypothetical protein
LKNNVKREQEAPLIKDHFIGKINMILEMVKLIAQCMILKLEDTESQIELLLLLTCKDLYLGIHGCQCLILLKKYNLQEKCLPEEKD